MLDVVYRAQSEESFFYYRRYSSDKSFRICFLASCLSLRRAGLLYVPVQQRGQLSTYRLQRLGEVMPT